MDHVLAEGQGMIEYALIITLVALVAAAGFITLGETLVAGFGESVSKVASYLGL